MKIIWMFKRFWLLWATYQSALFAEFCQEVQIADLEWQIRSTSDPLLRKALKKVRESKGVSDTVINRID